MVNKITPPLWNKILWAVAIVSIILGAQMGSWFWGMVVGIGLVLYLQNKFGDEIEASNRIEAEAYTPPASSSSFENNPEPATQQRDNEDLVVLMFIARADGKFTDKEKQVIKKHLLQDCKEEDAETILKALYKMNPSRERFQLALKALSTRTADEKQSIYDAVLEMSDRLNKRNEITESAISLALKELESEHQHKQARKAQM